MGLERQRMCQFKGGADARGEAVIYDQKNKIGLGHCVIAQWPNGRPDVVTDFGTENQAQNWIEQDAAHGLSGCITGIQK